MVDITNRYMTVSMDIMPTGLNLTMWMTTIEFWSEETAQFPYLYTHVSDTCTWVIHANCELSIKVCALVVNEADKICAEQTAHNNRRKLANR